MGAHSIVGPSGAARRIQCPRSVTLETQFPETEQSQDAAEGDAAHWAVAEMLQGRLVDVGVIAPNGVALTEEMCRGADLMYDDVVRSLQPYGLQPHQGQIEQTIAIPRVHPLAFGSPDFYILIAGAPATLLIWDYKFGHRIVEAFENPQLVDYIAGATEGIHDTLQGCNVVAKIVQPRGYHREGPIRTWETTLVALRGLLNISESAAAQALGPDPKARVGPECRDCRARHACPELRRVGFHAMSESVRAMPEVLDADAAAVELRMVREAIERLQARESGLEAQLVSELKSGRRVAGWMLEESSGRERWKVPAEQVIALGNAFKINLAKPPEAITPNQARDAGLDPAIVKEMADRQRGAATLVFDNGSAARRMFT